MEIDIIRNFLGLCAVFNIIVMAFWGCFLLFVPGWLYRYSSNLISISQEHFNSIHYSLFGLFKLAVIMFNLVPYFALGLMG